MYIYMYIYIYICNIPYHPTILTHDTVLRNGNAVHVPIVYSELASHLALWLGTDAQVPDSRGKVGASESQTWQMGELDGLEKRCGE